MAKKMKTILQHDARDCGAACLAMIASYYGLHLSMARCRELTKTDKSGVNIYGLISASEQVGLHGEALSGDENELFQALSSGEVHFPFIAHIISEDAMLHYVVVQDFKKGKFIIADPAKGTLRQSAEEFFKLWTGHIVTFEKTENFQKGDERKGRFTRFFSLLQGQYRKLTVIFLLSILIAAIGIVGAFTFEMVIDHFSTQQEIAESTEDEILLTADEDEGGEAAIEDEEEGHEGHDHSGVSGALEMVVEDLSQWISLSSFSLIFVLVIFLYLLQAGIQIVRGQLIIFISKKIDLRMVMAYYKHLMDLPVSSIEVRQTGEYISRLSDASAIREAVSTATLTLMLDSLMVIGCGCILYFENRLMFLASLVMVLLYTAVFLLYYKPVERANRSMMEDNARMQAYLKESLDGISTVKVHTAAEQVKASAESRFRKFLNSAVRNATLSLTQDVTADAIEQIGTVIILWIGFSMVLGGHITIGSLMTFYVLLGYFTQPIKNLIELQPTLQSAFVAADRLGDVLDLKAESTEAGDAVQGDAWRFENVDFRYGNRERTLQNVSLEVKQGEKIAIIGESGCGKTTLAKLLFRFYDPEGGAVTVDGKDLRQISLQSLREKIAYVSQETFLFSDTILNNLKLGNENATQEEIEKACQKSHAAEFIDSLPLGYQTPLDENGANLSGGQKQRLAIARALLRNPKLLILDEATSNLDSIAEAAIRDAVFESSGDIGCIIIAHRLSTVRNCDRIYVMNQGQIVENGTHDELIQRKGFYKALWDRQ